MFDAVKNTLKQNYVHESPNYINTYTHFVQNLKDFYNGLANNDIYSNNYMPEAEAQKQSKIMGMALNSIAYLRFGRFEQAFANSDTDDILNTCFQAQNQGIETCTSYNQNAPLSSLERFQKYYKNTKKQYLKSMINSILYFWRNNHIYDTTTFENFDEFKFYPEAPEAPAGDEQVEIDAYEVSLQNIRPNEPSMLSPTIIRHLGYLHFEGTIHTPAGASYPNNGYAAGETDNQIWSKIIGTFFGPLLYCKYGGIYEALLG